MDTVKVRALYMDGDFEEAIRMVEDAIKAKRLFSHSDSVFAYKHLGVMFAAKYETMEKGKMFMYQLLTIEPAARIMDMYASEMIYMIFRNVQTEYEIRHARPKESSHLGQQGSESGKKVPDPKVSKGHAWPYWTAGAVALALGAGVTAYFILEHPTSEVTRYQGGL